MFNKQRVIVFNIVKDDTIKIIDALSRYSYANRSLTIVDCGLADRTIYCVELRCKDRQFNICMNTIMDLVKDGVSITRLSTF